MNNKTGVAEWAQHSCNIQVGCENDCKYCYAKQINARFRRNAAAWNAPVLCPKKINKRYQRRNGVIMFPTSHDITPSNVPYCEMALFNMLDAGNEVLIVSKMNPICIERLVKSLKLYKKQVEFRCTIGSYNREVLNYWEPGAPSWEERVSARTMCLWNDYKTSISMEPMLDMEYCESFFIDCFSSIWIGAMTKTAKAVRDAAPKPLPTPEYFRGLYERYRDSKVVRFKESARRLIII